MEICTYGDPVDASGSPATFGAAFAFATSSCSATTTTIATTSDIVVLPTFSAGEAMVSLLLLVLVLLQVGAFAVGALEKIKTRRTYEGRGSSEGKEVYEQ